MEIDRCVRLNFHNNKHVRHETAKLSSLQTIRASTTAASWLKVHRFTSSYRSDCLNISFVARIIKSIGNLVSISNREGYCFSLIEAKLLT